MTTRTHFSFRVDTWTPDGESIVEHVARRGLPAPRLAALHKLGTVSCANIRWNA
jgi:hypothetical protein